MWAAACVCLFWFADALWTSHLLVISGIKLCNFVFPIMASSVMSQCHIYCNMPCTMTSSPRGKQPMGTHGGESTAGHRNDSSQSVQAKRPVTMVNSLGSNVCVCMAYAPCVRLHYVCPVGGYMVDMIRFLTPNMLHTWNRRAVSPASECISTHSDTYTAVVTYSYGNYSS